MKGETRVRLREGRSWQRRSDLVCQFLPRRMGVAAIDAVVAKRRKQLEGLADYRKGMIYAYVTGKKEVAA